MACFAATMGARAQTNLIQLRSFGATAFSGSQPEAPLLSASDGFFYGTTPFGGTGGDGTLFRIGRDGKGFTILKQLSFTNSGSRPYSPLIEGKDGFLYGTTYAGGARGLGTVFKISKDGATHTVLKNFGTALGDGTYPVHGLAEAFNGFLYGTTTEGGNFGLGTIFRIGRDGANYSVIHHFSAAATNGYQPSSGLVVGPNLEGFLYGTTSAGGSNGVGTVYRVSTNGSGFKVLLAPPVDAGAPEVIEGGVIIAKSDGLLYGVSRYGGTNDSGTVFRLGRDGSSFSTLYHFKALNDGLFPSTPLLEAADGRLYGVTPEGGTNNNNRGTLFRLDRSGANYTVLRNFGIEAGDAIEPSGGLVEVTNTLFGVSVQGGGSADGAMFRISREGTSYSVLFGFSSAGGDGYSLEHPVLARGNGDVFGVTRDGGESGGGTLYRMGAFTTNYTIIHHFSSNPTNLLNPSGPLLDAADGFLYGVAQFGGQNGSGGVYRIGTNGTGFQIVRSFTDIPADGRQPMGALHLGSDGALYGTTLSGGATDNGVILNNGVVYRLTRDGNEILPLHAFVDGTSDGALPRAGVAEVNGFVYGTAPYGGTTDWGVLYRVGLFGDGYQVLHHFTTNSADGLDPHGELLVASDNRLYGVTRSGGSAGLGTVFRYDPATSGYAVIFSVTNSAQQGFQPVGRLVEGADGLLYGAMSAGGSFGGGTLFRLAKTGTGFNTLYHFSISGEGRIPLSGLTQSGTNLFGTTYAGGSAGLGTVFRFLAPPPAPTIVAHPVSVIGGPGGTVLLSVSANASGAIGYQWTRNGTNLVDATGSNLVLGPLTFADAGAYAATVSSSGGQVSTTNAAVVVFAGEREGNTLQLQFAGPAGRQFRLQSRTNFQASTPWQTFSNVVLQGTNQTVTDPQNATRPERYFRAMLP